jgi:hypothetical protein
MALSPGELLAQAGRIHVSGLHAASRLRHHAGPTSGESDCAEGHHHYHTGQLRPDTTAAATGAGSTLADGGESGGRR